MRRISKVLASRDAAVKSSSSSTSSSSDSSSYSSSDSEDAVVEEAQGVPNPPLGIHQGDGSDVEYIPNSALNVGPPSPDPDSDVERPVGLPSPDPGCDVERLVGLRSPDPDSDMERPSKVQRCSLCADFDDLLEQHLSMADALEKSEKKVAELQGLLNVRA